MKCKRCNGNVAEQEVSVCVCDVAQPIKIEGVPAQVCERCGDRTFHPDVSRVVDAITKGQRFPNAVKLLRVFEYANAVVPLSQPVVIPATVVDGLRQLRGSESSGWRDVA